MATSGPASRQLGQRARHGQVASLAPPTTDTPYACAPRACAQRLSAQCSVQLLNQHSTVQQETLKGG